MILGVDGQDVSGRVADVAFTRLKYSVAGYARSTLARREGTASVVPVRFVVVEKRAPETPLDEAGWARCSLLVRSGDQIQSDRAWDR